MKKTAVFNLTRACQYSPVEYSSCFACKRYLDNPPLRTAFSQRSSSAEYRFHCSVDSVLACKFYIEYLMAKFGRTRKNVYNLCGLDHGRAGAHVCSGPGKNTTTSTAVRLELETYWRGNWCGGLPTNAHASRRKVDSMPNQALGAVHFWCADAQLRSCCTDAHTSQPTRKRARALTNDTLIINKSVE